jgi:hypothetical protein
MTHEELPLSVVFREVMAFLVERPDVVLFGAHAVNAYCATERMTQDVDVLSTHAAEVAEQLRAHLAGKLHAAIRVREVVPGEGFRVYQLRKPANRDLVDVRQVGELPPARLIEGLQVIAPPDLVAMKVTSVVHRQGRPKGDTDLADLRRLLLAFPELKATDGPVLERLRGLGASDAVLARWAEISVMTIVPDEDEGY